MKSILFSLLAYLALALSISAEDISTEKLKIEEGKKIFTTYCIVCHGQTGKGDGVGAAALDPKPRDFTGGSFKFSSTPKDQPPSDADLIKTISQGSPGTAMPPWEGVLNQAQKEQVIAYIKTFNPEFWKKVGVAKKTKSALKPSEEKSPEKKK